MSHHDLRDLLACEPWGLLTPQEQRALPDACAVDPSLAREAECLAEACAAFGDVSAEELPPRLWDELEQRLTTEPELVELECGHCHDSLLRPQAEFCAGCLTPHHGACVAKHGSCSTPRCQGAQNFRPPTTARPHALAWRPVAAVAAALVLLVPTLALLIGEGTDEAEGPQAAATASTPQEDATPHPTGAPPPLDRGQVHWALSAADSPDSPARVPTLTQERFQALSPGARQDLLQRTLSLTLLPSLDPQVVEALDLPSLLRRGTGLLLQGPVSTALAPFAPVVATGEAPLAGSVGAYVHPTLGQASSARVQVPGATLRPGATSLLSDARDTPLLASHTWARGRVVYAGVDLEALYSRERVLAFWKQTRTWAGARHLSASSDAVYAQAVHIVESRDTKRYPQALGLLRSIPRDAARFVDAQAQATWVQSDLLVRASAQAKPERARQLLLAALANDVLSEDVRAATARRLAALPAAPRPSPGPATSAHFSATPMAQVVAYLNRRAGPLVIADPLAGDCLLSLVLEDRPWREAVDVVAVLSGTEVVEAEGCLLLLRPELTAMPKLTGSARKVLYILATLIGLDLDLDPAVSGQVSVGGGTWWKTCKQAAKALGARVSLRAGRLLVTRGSGARPPAAPRPNAMGASLEASLHNTESGAVLSLAGTLPRYPNGTKLHVTLAVKGLKVEAAFFMTQVRDGVFKARKNFPRRTLAPLTYELRVELWLQAQRKAIADVIRREWGLPSGAKVALARHKMNVGTRKEQIAFREQTISRLLEFVDRAQTSHGEVLQQLNTPKGADPLAWKATLRVLVKRVQAHFGMPWATYLGRYVVLHERAAVADLQLSKSSLGAAISDYAKGLEAKAQRRLKETAARLTRLEEELQSR